MPDIPDGDCDCIGNQVTSLVFVEDCTLDEDCNGVCDNAEVPGCNISQACNFNALATQDDGLVNSSVVWPAARIQMRATMIQRRSTTMDIV